MPPSRCNERSVACSHLHPPEGFRLCRTSNSPYAPTMRTGVTVLELLTVLTTIGIISLVAVPRVVGWWDGLLTQRAAREVALFYSRARLGAVFRAQRVRIEFTEESLRAFIDNGSDSAFLHQPGPGRGGVSMSASRPVIRLAPTGFGWGAANTKLVLRRGAAAESLTTSRLGRLKLWR